MRDYYIPTTKKELLKELFEYFKDGRSKLRIMKKKQLIAIFCKKREERNEM